MTTQNILCEDPVPAKTLDGLAHECHPGPFGGKYARVSEARTSA